MHSHKSSGIFYFCRIIYSDVQSCAAEIHFPLKASSQVVRIFCLLTRKKAFFQIMSNFLFQVKENGVAYEFDFSRVYWNPRLSTEHERVVQLVKRGDTMFDVFAGVGPFTIPAARRGANIFANDLNPESYRWLQHNCKLNKVESRVQTFNLDGREFIRGPLKQELPALLKGGAGVHVVMNLPALALEFLDAFRGLLKNEPPCDLNLPTVYCYGFSKDDNPDADMVKRASSSLGFPLESKSTVHFVRNVAPNKDMMCIRFTLPKEILFCKNDEPQGEF